MVNNDTAATPSHRMPCRVQRGINGRGYCPHIDGLRAVAVLLVLFFHYGLGATGGYTGVDVFFVISGFLITSIILRDLEGGSFTLANFWERRARRILPALAVVLGAVFLAAWFLFLPSDFMNLGESLFAQAVFLQNVVFWHGEGYFSALAETQPLLHTWSLAVEEQYYLIFPAALLLLSRWGGRRLFVPVLAATALISFALGVAGIRFFPSASFYFLPTRAWELLAGALVALAPVCDVGRWRSESLSAAALAGVIYAGFFFNSATPFPGWAALLPGGGTALFLFSNRCRPTWSARALSWKPIVFVGLISYSLYLWHWPLLVFFKYWSLGELSVSFSLGLLVLALGLAAFSWRFIEQPVRKKTILPSRRAIAGFSAAVLICCASVGAAAYWTDGLPGRMSPELLRYAAAAREKGYQIEMNAREIRKGQLFHFGESKARPDVVLWGDSLAMALLPGLDRFCLDHKLAGVSATHSATPPLLDFDYRRAFSLQDEARPFARAVVDYINATRPSHVILSGAWSAYAAYPEGSDPESRHQIFSEALRNTLAALAPSGARIWIVSEPPRHGHLIPRILARKKLFGIEPGRLIVGQSGYARQQAEVREAWAGVVPEPAIIEASEWFKQADGSFLVEEEGYPLYRDAMHLSERGSLHLRNAFMALLKPTKETPEAR